MWFKYEGNFLFMVFLIIVFFYIQICEIKEIRYLFLIYLIYNDDIGMGQLLLIFLFKSEENVRFEGVEGYLKFSQVNVRSFLMVFLDMEIVLFYKNRN